MAKGKPPKDKQYNGQSTNSIMAKGNRPKEKQYTGQRKTTKGQTI
jgi:hypothetical protein